MRRKISSEQRKAMFARLKGAGFSNLSTKFIVNKAEGKPITHKVLIYEHPRYGKLQTKMTKDELDEKYGKGWKKSR
jgi:hypothetical protein